MNSIVLYRQGDAWLPFSEYDLYLSRKYPEMRMTRHQVTGAKKMRSYRELCAYMGSCTYIATLGIEATDENTGRKIKLVTKEAIDDATRFELGFCEWLPTFSGKPIPKMKHLCYENCDQDDAHVFIIEALEYHAELAGVSDMDRYLRFLEGRG